MTSRQEQERREYNERFIPIHIRFVPKDVWLRMHIDTKSTIGSVKDAVLERLKLPPYDPTVFTGFYEYANQAMAKPAIFPSEAKSFPKAFVARGPKKTVAEVMECDMKRERNTSSDITKSSPSKLNPRSRGKDNLTAAKLVLGGEPGEGGIGKMGYVGLYLPQDLQQKKLNVVDGGKITRATILSSSSSTSSKLINSVKGSKGPKSRASMISLSNVAKGGQVTTSQNQQDERKSLTSSSKSPPSNRVLTSSLSFDPTEAVGLDAYSDHLFVTLSGNAEAKRKEKEAAVAFLNRIESNNSIAPDRTQEIIRSNSTSDSSPSVSSSLHDAPLTAGNVEATDLDFDYSTTDDEWQGSSSEGKRTTSKSIRSSGSDSSVLSHLQKQYSSLSSPQLGTGEGRGRGGGGGGGGGGEREMLVVNDAVSDGVASITLSNATTERGRSGTIIAAQDSRKGKPASQGVQGSSADVLISSSDDHHPMGNLTTSDRPRNKVSDASKKKVEDTTSGTPPPPLAAPAPASRTVNRIAGIHMDEISSWRDAQHDMSPFYSVQSFSNGHLLEDWRTVAAFRLRPYELLEIQYANPQDKFHLPRRGDKTELNMVRRSSSLSLLEAESGGGISSNDRYIEHFSEGWCYVFKRNSGTSKAQRAGLGVWKLRYIIVRGSKLVVHRKKPARTAINDPQIGMAWDLNLIECVFSERADGVTRPALMSMEGVSTEMITLCFQAATAPTSTINMDLSSTTLSLSMRFISHADHCAFFNTFARAHLKSGQKTLGGSGAAAAVNEWRKKVIIRAMIAGRGGTVLPGRAGRRGGRNALSRVRLRPSGVSRDYDDADRWSSQSESEEYGRATRQGAFNYADIYASIEKGKGGASLDPTYEQIDPSYQITMRRQQEESKLQRLQSPTGSEVATTTAPSPSVSISHTERPSSKAGRSRGFSLANTAKRVVSPPEIAVKVDTIATAKTPNNTGSAKREVIGVSRPPSQYERKRGDLRNEYLAPRITPATPSQRHFRNSSEVGPHSPLHSPTQASHNAAAASTVAGGRAAGTVGGSGSSPGGVSRLSQPPSNVSSFANTGRLRSHTVASSPSSTSEKKSNASKQNLPTTPSGNSSSNTFWPFRAAYPRTAPFNGTSSKPGTGGSGGA